MDVIPREILGLIYKFLSTSELLHFRTVSRTWNDEIIRLCKLRGTWLRKFGREGLFTYQHFSSLSSAVNPKKCIWSGLALSVWQDEVKQRYSGISKLEVAEFLKKFGENISSVQLIGDDVKSFVNLLVQIPNITEIEFDSIIDTLISGEMGYFNLCCPFRKLKTIKLEVSRASEFNFLQLLLAQTNGFLQQCDLRTSCTSDPPDENVAKNIQRLATLLQEIPSISLAFHCFGEVTREVLNAFSKLPMNITVLSLDLDLDVYDDFLVLKDIIGRFISNVASSLVELDVTDTSRIQEVDEAIDLPIFSKLKTLHFFVNQCDTFNENFIGPISQFSPGKVQHLETVEVFNVINPFQIFVPGRYVSINSLVIHTQDMDSKYLRRWNGTFPNVTRLELMTICFDGLLYIFTYMTHLVHLTMNLDNLDPYDDYNDTLCGLPNAKEFFETGFEIDAWRAQHPCPSLISMKNLKVLCLMARKLDESSVYLCFLKMQSLHLLELIGSVISKECEERLGSFHQIFRNRLY